LVRGFLLYFDLMKIQYLIQEEDFYTYQVFTASQSKRVQRQRSRGRLILLAMCTLGMWVFYFDNALMTFYFAGVFLAVLLGYGRYFSWRFKKHYRAHIKEYYSGRFGLEETIVLEDEVVISTNKMGESKLNISEFEKISETRSHLFLHMSTGNTLIIPTHADGVEAFKHKLVDKGVSRG
jgi:hypothetical protein